MKTILILMDSLNRHYLSLYGESWVKTPNLERLAARGTVFEKHHCGSMPCMPARREMFTGRLNFLETPWGPIEPWDTCVQPTLRTQKGVYSHMITDHYHYFHRGGYNYHTQFDSWEFLRGQEGDVWHPLVNPPSAPEGTRGRGVQRRAYWSNRQFIDPERDEDYPTPQCFEQAVKFLDHNHAADNWLLHLEVFDPHEPFDCSSRWRELYNDTWDRGLYTWPAYDRLDEELDDEAAVAHIRKSYAATLTRADHYLGKLLDKMDAYGLWEDTCVILTTDHGHLLGEHNYWAKNYMFDFRELAHIPLVVCAPGIEGGKRVNALTATIDLAPTLLELFGADVPAGVHGRSLLHLLRNDEPHHDAVLFGYFGKDVNLTDGTYTYCRQPAEGTVCHLHTATPVDCHGVDDDNLRRAELGRFLPSADGIPHYRLEKQSRRHRDAPDRHLVYNLRDDPRQEHPVDDPALEARLVEKLTELLVRAEAPPCQYQRLGLEPPQG